MDSISKLQKLLGRMDAQSIIDLMGDVGTLPSVLDGLLPDSETPQMRQFMVNDARADWWADQSVPRGVKWIVDASVTGEHPGAYPDMATAAQQFQASLVDYSANRVVYPVTRAWDGLVDAYANTYPGVSVTIKSEMELPDDLERVEALHKVIQDVMLGRFQLEFDAAVLSGKANSFETYPLLLDSLRRYADVLDKFLDEGEAWSQPTA